MRKKFRTMIQDAGQPKIHRPTDFRCQEYLVNWIVDNLPASTKYAAASSSLRAGDSRGPTWQGQSHLRQPGLPRRRTEGGEVLPS